MLIPGHLISEKKERNIGFQFPFTKIIRFIAIKMWHFSVSWGFPSNILICICTLWAVVIAESQNFKIPDIPNDIEKIELTPIERIYFNRFKGEVGANFTQEYMTKDMYLIKWLRSSGFKIPVAVEKIRLMLEWRKEYGMDNITEEDFSDLEREFPITMDGHDYFGRPVGTADIADWDIRKAILTGRKEKAIRFVYRLAEIGVLKVMEAHEKFPNVSSGTLVANMAGFNKNQHACAECIPVFRNLVVSLEKYFPFMLHKLFVINTPQSFYSVFRLFVPIMGKYTKGIIKVYGPDKRQWKSVLLSEIPPDQLEPQFGGTRKGRHEK